jgi:hypothetical protein
MDDFNAIAARLAEISTMIKQLEEEKQKPPHRRFHLLGRLVTLTV